MADMQIRRFMANAIREPFIHFLLAGLAIFVVFGLLGTETDAGDRRIVVNEAQVRRLADQWSQTWQRPPNAIELDGLIRDYIKEEIYYREALRLGLDRDDVIVRRRMRSKMEFLADSETEAVAPGDAELQAWLDKYPAKYATDPVYSLDQVFVDTSRGDAVAVAKAKAILGQLQAGARPGALGDPLALPRSLDRVAAFDINRQYGDEFANALKALPVGKWSGPVASGLGLHLIRIRNVQLSGKPRLADVRQAVENDWREATREDRESRAYQKLLDGYRIEIEKPE
jgi:hypothetical protein